MSTEPVVLIVSPSIGADGRKAYSTRGQLFDGKVDGQVVVERSTQPFLDGARRLIKLGYDPKVTLVMRHAGSDVDALRATIGAAARLTVNEGEDAPRFVRWEPSPHAQERRRGSPPIEFGEEPVPEAAE
jgi:hypothetical protein